MFTNACSRLYLFSINARNCQEWLATWSRVTLHLLPDTSLLKQASERILLTSEILRTHKTRPDLPQFSVRDNGVKHYAVHEGLTTDSFNLIRTKMVEYLQSKFDQQDENTHCRTANKLFVDHRFVRESSTGVPPI